MALKVVKKQKRDTPKSEVEILREQIEQLQKENEELKSKKTTSKKVEKEIIEYPFDIYLETDHYINIPRQLVHDLTDVKSSLALSIYVALKDAEKGATGKAQISLESLAHLARSTPKTVKQVIKERLSKYISFKNGHSTESSTYYFKKLEGTEIKLTPESTLYSKIGRDLFETKEGKQVCIYPGLFNPANKKNGIHLQWIREDKGGDKNFVLNPKYHRLSGLPVSGRLSFEQLQEMLKDDFNIDIVQVGEEGNPRYYEIDVKDDEFKSTICALWQGNEDEYKIYDDWTDLARDLIETLNYESMETQKQCWIIKGVPYTAKKDDSTREVEISYSKADEIEKPQEDKPVENETPKGKSLKKRGNFTPCTMESLRELAKTYCEMKERNGKKAYVLPISMIPNKKLQQTFYEWLEQSHIESYNDMKFTYPEYVEFAKKIGTEFHVKKG